MITLNKKIVSLIIIIFLLTWLFLCRSWNYRRYSIFSYTGIDKHNTANNLNTFNKKKLDANTTKAFGISLTKEQQPSSPIEQKTLLLTGANVPEFRPPLPSPFDDDKIENICIEIEMRQLFKTQDQIMDTWPIYSDVQKQLSQELMAKLNFEDLSCKKLVETALAFREQFWKSGGNFSKTSYIHAYKSRILLEVAHNKDPENMFITDELVETIQATGMTWNYKTNSNKVIKNSNFLNTLLSLRSEQYDQIKKKIGKGGIPVWEDFVRINDLGWLLHRTNDYQSARKVVEWLIQNADNGGWKAYIQPLTKWQQLLAEGKTKYNYNIYIATKTSLSEELKYCRRLSSFKGPEQEKRGLTPAHLVVNSPSWE